MLKEYVSYLHQFTSGARARHELWIDSLRAHDTATVSGQVTPLRILDLANGRLLAQYALLRAAGHTVYGTDLVNRPPRGWTELAYAAARRAFCAQARLPAWSADARDITCSDSRPVPCLGDVFDLFTSRAGFEDFTAVGRLIYWARDLRSRPMFDALERYCGGHVLDVGGGTFYLTARRRSVPCDTWTTVDSSAGAVTHVRSNEDARLRLVVADGCRLPFASDQFDTALSIQVLEHVLDPMAMVGELARVLRPGAYALLLIPQTATMHAAPHHYYNFTRFWIEQCMARCDLEVVQLVPLGGVWSSMASHLLFQYLQAARYPGLSTNACRRNAWFYVLYPLMAVYALVSIPICMLFSLGDMTEEPNNHLVVARKRP